MALYDKSSLMYNNAPPPYLFLSKLTKISDSIESDQNVIIVFIEYAKMLSLQ